MKLALQLIARSWARTPFPLTPATTVLGYHSVAYGGGSLSVAPPVFADQMAALAASRSTLALVSLDEARAALEQRQAPRRSVVVTFDDAWADNHTHALGPLVDFGIPATLYVPSGLLGTPGYLTRSQLLEMVSAGVRVGAHSRTHPDLRRCDDATLEAEVRGSKDDLESLTGKPVTSFAYPTGYHDARVVAAVATARFATAVTTRRGWLRRGTDPLRIPRSFIEEFPLSTFRAAAAGGLVALAPIDRLRGEAGSG